MSDWAIDKKGRIFLNDKMVLLVEEYDRTPNQEDEPELLLRNVTVMGRETYVSSTSLGDEEKDYEAAVWQSHLITTTDSVRFPSAEEHKKIKPPAKSKKGKKK